MRYDILEYEIQWYKMLFWYLVFEMNKKNKMEYIYFFNV